MARSSPSMIESQQQPLPSAEDVQHSLWWSALLLVHLLRLH